MCKISVFLYLIVKQGNSGARWSNTQLVISKYGGGDN